jgi:hypothetical protein
MFAVYIIYDNQITDIIKYNNVFNKLNKSVTMKTIDKYIIGYNIQFYNNNHNEFNIKILNLDEKIIKDNLITFYAYKLFKNYTYCIELDFNFNHMIDINKLDQDKFDICSGYNSNILMNEIFSYSELEVIKKLNKNINFSLFNNKIVNNFKIYNISSLHMNTFYENITYIYNKLLLNNINASNIQLYTIYQILYPNYISFKLLETIPELILENEEVLDDQLTNELDEDNSNIILYLNSDVIIKNQLINYYLIDYNKEINWYVIRSHFKKLNNNTILSLRNTYLKKSKIKENKLDPKDKIYFPIGRKLRLKNNQPYEYFYCVFYN